MVSNLNQNQNQPDLATDGSVCTFEPEDINKIADFFTLLLEIDQKNKVKAKNNAQTKKAL